MVKAAFAFIGFVLSCGVATADCEPPPSRYDFAFAGPVVIDDSWDGSISAIGNPCYPWNGSVACAKREGPVCKIWSQRGKLTSQCKRHEVAHCNGWAPIHPAGFPLWLTLLIIGIVLALGFMAWRRGAFTVPFMDDDGRIEKNDDHANDRRRTPSGG